MAISGTMPYALTMAPRSPTSSCTVATAYTSATWLSPARSRIASIMAATPARLSSALPQTRVPCSLVKRRLTTTGSPTRTRRRASSPRRPTSMNSSSMGCAFARSASTSRCGGLTPTNPGSGGSDSTMTSCATRVRGSMPPMAVKRRKPSSSIFVTMRPISSMWAAIMSRGRRSAAGAVPARLAMTLPSASTRTSSQKGLSASATSCATERSEPDGPAVSDRAPKSSVRRWTGSSAGTAGAAAARSSIVFMACWDTSFRNGLSSQRALRLFSAPPRGFLCRPVAGGHEAGRCSRRGDAGRRGGEKTKNGPARGRSWPGGRRLHGDDFRHFRHLRLDDALDTGLQGEHRHRAAAAGAHQLHSDNAVFGHVDQLHVAAVHLHRGTDALQRRLDPLTHGGDVGHGSHPFLESCPLYQPGVYL